MQAMNETHVYTLLSILFHVSLKSNQTKRFTRFISFALDLKEGWKLGSYNNVHVLHYK